MSRQYLTIDILIHFFFWYKVTVILFIAIYITNDTIYISNIVHPMRQRMLTRSNEAQN